LSGRGIRAVLFDKDGTLLDFDATWGPATADVLAALSGGDAACFADLSATGGFEPETGSFRPDSPIIGGDLPDFAPAWAERLGLAFDDAFVARVDAMFRAASLASLVGYDDVAACLARLAAAGLPIGLATNDSEATARAHLAKLGILDRFAFVSGFDSGWGGKPGPGMVAAFARAVGVPAAAVCLVGDSPHDIEAARRAGARGVGIARTARAAEVLGDAPEHTVAALAGLLAWLGLEEDGPPSA
jgi:phosphoglycolate phosphatase